MISFPHAISLLEQRGLLSTIPKQLIIEAPLYVHHHGDQEVRMPSRADWEAFSTLPEFPKVLPAPITKTIQTASSLRGFRIYSILISDGDNLLAHKLIANDSMLFMVVQNHKIQDTLQKLKEPGQPLQVFNKCCGVFPVVKEVPETDPGMKDLGLTFIVTTMHFIYSIHLDKEKYKRA